MYITVSKLIELEATKLFIKRCFNEDLQESSDKIKEISKYLLISFYFQQSNKDSADTALEFFHNSLWEFLTAEYLWEQNKKNILKIDEYGEYEIINKESYYNFLSNSVGNKKINEFSIASNLVEIIENEDEEVKKEIFKNSINLFYDLSKDDFLFNYNRNSCLLSPFEKASENFSLFWIFVHESNRKLKNKIIAKSKILDFLFYFSMTSNLLTISNVIFEDDTFNINHRRLFKFEIEECIITTDMYNYILTENKFRNIKFNNLMMSEVIFKNNNFSNISIDKTYIGSSTKFYNNYFENVKFNETKIENENWFNDFLENNNFEEDFIERHFVEKRIEKDYSEKEVENYYIMYKG